MNNFSGNQLPHDYGRPQEPSYGFPAPESQQLNQQSATELSGTVAVESGAGFIQPPVSVATPTQAATGVPSTSTMPQQPAVDYQNAGTATQIASVGLPQIADDTDLIEKEWVEKAKEIVERTRSDPHAQSKEIQHFRADYIKKRYNKDIKIEEG